MRSTAVAPRGSASAAGGGDAALQRLGSSLPLLDRPSPPDNLTRLARACRDHVPDEVERLLGAGAGPNVPCGPAGRSPLHWALAASVHQVQSEDGANVSNDLGATANSPGPGTASQRGGAATPRDAASPRGGASSPRGGAASPRGGSASPRGGSGIGAASPPPHHRKSAAHEAAHVVALLLRAKANVEAQDAVGVRPLHLACRHGHSLAARLLLDAGADADARDRLCAPIHYACAHGHESCALLLIGRGANLMATSVEGLTALGAVRRYRHEGRMAVTVQKLEEHASAAMKVASGKTDAAANYKPQSDSINVKDSVGNTQLAVAVRKDNLREARRLLSLGADPSLADFSGWAPLHIAARFKLVQMGLALIEAGAPYAPTGDGATPLDLFAVELDEDDEEANAPLFFALNKAATEYAAKILSGKLPPPPPKTFVPPVPFVLESASVNADGSPAKAKGASTAAAAAAASASAPAAGSAAAAAAAASAAASAAIAAADAAAEATERELRTLNDRDGLGRSQVLRAVREGKAEEADRLLRLGADPDLADVAGWAPLHHAASLGLDAMVPLLLARASRDDRLLGKDKRLGASADARLPAHAGADAARAGFTAAHLAVESGRDSTRRVLRRLREGGADLDARDAEGSGPLLLAVVQNRAAAVRALLALGADADAADAGGVSALLHALQWMRDGVAAALVERGAALPAEARAALAQLPPGAMQRARAAVAARDAAVADAVAGAGEAPRAGGDSAAGGGEEATSPQLEGY